MKKLQSLVLLFVLAVLSASCSSDSGSSSSNAFDFDLNGSQVTLTSTLAQKSDNSFVVIGDAADGSTIQLEFNKFGNIGRVSYWDSEMNVYTNFQYYKSHYFNFNLISVNESAHKVKVSFSGTLYDEETDMSSASVEVNGSFDLPYIEHTPAIAGLGLNCKIAGSDWIETDFWDNGWNSVDRKYLSDDDKMIIMRLEDEYIAPGTYNFTTASINKIQLAKYSTTTNEYTEYNASGTLTITSNSEPIFGIRIIEGTYSFTATNPSNPSDQVQVTNGTFKTNF